MRARTPAGVLTALLVAVGGVAPGVVDDEGRPAATRAQAAAGPRRSAAGERRACTRAPLAERAGQLLVVGLPGVTRASQPLARRIIGAGVGGVFLDGEANVRSSAQVRSLVTGLRRRAGRPLLVTTDEEGGRVSDFRDLLGASPSPRTLAATRSPAQVRVLGRRTAVGLADHGVNLDLAPVADLDAGPADGVIGDRSFSGRPRKAARYALAFSRGLVDGGVAPTVKHFPGHGRSAGDPHRATPVARVALRTLRRTDLVPFAAQIDAGVPVVMLNHVRYRALGAPLPASLSPDAYALLRGMGFRGVAITDSLGMGAVHNRWSFPRAAVRAVAAGADAVLATDGAHAREMRAALVAAVRDGRLPRPRLNQAAARVLALKGAAVRAATCRTPPPVPSMGRRAGR
ncbi:MAG: glycoside hydrolase family 3 protein [Actinobacteria bacterium]|nr:glycoside hydrolase family 3 protein [Actinomycetota bacterium]